MKKKLSVAIDAFGELWLVICSPCLRYIQPLICDTYTKQLCHLSGLSYGHGNRYTLHVQTVSPADCSGWWGVRVRRCRKDKKYYWHWCPDRYVDTPGNSVFFETSTYLSQLFRIKCNKLRRQHKACEFELWLKLTKESD